MPWSEEFKKRIIAKLEDRGVKGHCPRCGSTGFTLIDGFFNRPVQDDLGGMVLGGPSVPTVGTACTRCGFISEHAAGSLGLLPRSSDPEAEGTQDDHA